METLKKSEKEKILDKIEKIYISKGISGFEELIKDYDGPLNKRIYLKRVYQAIARRPGLWGSFDDRLVEKLLDLEVEEVNEVFNLKS